MRLICGAGLTGQSLLRYFARGGHDNIAVFDTRPAAAIATQLAALRKIQPSVTLYTERMSAAALDKITHVYCSPGFDTRHTVVQTAYDREIPVDGDIDLFVDHCDRPIVAVTGTNGKTTVAGMTTNILRVGGINAVCGANYGTPALDLLHEHPDAEAYVLELSSFQLALTNRLRAYAAVVLNVTPHHADRHAFLEYRAIKQRVYQGARYCIVNVDQPLLPEHGVTGEIREYSMVKWTTYHCREDRLWCHGEPVLNVRMQVLPHVRENCLAAVALADTFNLTNEQLGEGVRSYKPPPYRIQRVGSWNNIVWFNDAKATNVAAATAAVEAMRIMVDRHMVVLIGGHEDEQDVERLYKALLAWVREERLRGIISYGQVGDRFAHDMPLLPVICVPDLAAACAKAHEIAVTGDVVLLTPAATSFDAFSDYNARGAFFNDWVWQHVAPIRNYA